MTSEIFPDSWVLTSDCSGYAASLFGLYRWPNDFGSSFHHHHLLLQYSRQWLICLRLGFYLKFCCNATGFQFLAQRALSVCRQYIFRTLIRFPRIIIRTISWVPCARVLSYFWSAFYLTPPFGLFSFNGLKLMSGLALKSPFSYYFNCTKMKKYVYHSSCQNNCQSLQ